MFSEGGIPVIVLFVLSTLPHKILPTLSFSCYSNLDRMREKNRRETQKISESVVRDANRSMSLFMDLARERERDFSSRQNENLMEERKKN